MKLTTHLHLVLRLITGGTATWLPLYALHGMYRDNFAFKYITVRGLKSHKIRLISRLSNESTDYQSSSKGMFDVYKKTLYQSTSAKNTRHTSPILNHCSLTLPLRCVEPHHQHSFSKCQRYFLSPLLDCGSSNRHQLYAFLHLGVGAKNAQNQITKHQNKGDLLPLQYSCKDRVVIC
jgi:hypothetical protein